MTKVLIVEDDRFLSSAYKMKLAKEQYEVELAFDGEEAVEKALSFSPDIILLDLIMPKKDGFETLKDLKSNPKLKDIPVIVSSNLGQKEDIDKALALGAKDYFVKSDISLGDLLEKIKKTV